MYASYIFIRKGYTAVFAVAKLATGQGYPDMSSTGSFFGPVA